MEHRTAEASRRAGIAYHLVPLEVWQARGGETTYLPDAYEADGFIHMTNGLEPLLQVANLFYRSDAREYLVLVVDTGRLASELRYDDEDEIYPHIYGPLNTDAVIGRLAVERNADGSFTGFRSA